MPLNLFDLRPNGVGGELLDELIKTAREIFEGSDSFSPLRPDSFLAVKGVIEPVEEETNVSVIQERDSLIIADLEKALSELSLARKVEGANISKSLEFHYVFKRFHNFSELQKSQKH